MTRVALITGGGRGLGRIMAHALIEAGHRVVLTSTDQASLAETIRSSSKPGNVRAIVADLAKPGVAEKLAEEAQAAFGQVDILVNNAGVSLGNIRTDTLARPFRFWEATREQMELFYAINTVAAQVLAGALAPKMVDRGWGRIIANTTSLDSMLRFSLYGGSKAALEAETAVQASDLEGTGVTANVLIPGGGTGSRMTDLMGIPREVVLPPEIMGPPIAFIASDAANHFNGRRLYAREFDRDIDPLEAAERASDPIAWMGAGRPGFQPKMAQKKTGS